MSKKLIFWVGGIAGFLLLAALIAPLFIPWDKLKDKAVAEVSKSLGRELKVGAVGVSLFTGVRAKEISLANAKGPGFSKQPLFSVQDAKINVSLLSLLSGKVVINSITFIKPQILLETNGAGVSALKGLGAKGASSAKPQAKSEGSSEAPLVVVASFVIQDGDIVVRDKRKKTEMALHGLQLKLQGLRLGTDGESRLELKLTYESKGQKLPISLVSGFKLDLKGKNVDLSSLELTAPALQMSANGKVLNWEAPKLDLYTDLRIDLGALPKLLPPSKTPMDLGGRAHLKLKLKGSPDALARLGMDGSLSFEEVSYASGDMPSVSGFNGSLKLTQATAQSDDLKFKLGGDPVAVGLKVNWGNLAQLTSNKAQANMTLDLKADSVKGFVQAAAASSPESKSLQQMKGKIEGALSVQAVITGLALSGGAKQPYQNVDAKFQLKDGLLRQLDMLEKLAASIPHPETQALLRKDIRFTQMLGEANLTPARTTLKSLVLGSGEDWRGGDIYAQAHGFMIPGKSVDFQVTPHFNPAVVKVGGEVGEALQDDKGWVTYDYLAYYGPDMDRAKADFGPGLKKAAQKALNKQVDKLKSQAQQEAKQKAGDLVKEKAPELIKQLPDGLKGIFGQ